MYKTRPICLESVCETVPSSNEVKCDQMKVSNVLVFRDEKRVLYQNDTAANDVGEHFSVMPSRTLPNCL